MLRKHKAPAPPRPTWSEPSPNTFLLASAKHMIMNTEREQQLSALLDDQLSPDERRSVEEAVASDPAAAEALRSLAGVRDLVAGLSRPTGPDLAPEILKRLELRNSRQVGERFAIRPLRLVALAAGIAASLAGVALIGERFQPAHQPAPRVVRAPSEIPLVEAAPEVDATSPAVAELIGPPAPIESTISTDDKPTVAIASTEPPSAEAPAAVDPERRLVRELLDDHPSPRIFLVTDLKGEATDERVALLLGLSTHRDFHRIELSGDKVFAATLDPDELATLRERLATAFPDRFEESDEKPAVAARLAEQGRVSTLAANPAADVRIPPTNLAIRFPPRDGRNWRATDQGNEPTTKGEPANPNPGAALASDEVNRQPRPIQIWIMKPSAE